MVAELEAIAAVVTAVAAVTVAALHAITIAMANFSLHARKAHARRKAKVVVGALAAPAWDSLRALQMSHVLPAPLRVNQTPCAPAWI